MKHNKYQYFLNFCKLKFKIHNTCTIRCRGNIFALELLWAHWFCTVELNWFFCNLLLPLSQSSLFSKIFISFCFRHAQWGSIINNLFAKFFARQVLQIVWRTVQRCFATSTNTRRSYINICFSLQISFTCLTFSLHYLCSNLSVN